MLPKISALAGACALAFCLSSSAFAQVSPADPGYVAVSQYAMRAAQALMAQERMRGHPVSLARLQRAEIEAVESAQRNGLVDSNAAAAYLENAYDAVASGIASAAARSEIAKSQVDGHDVNAIGVDKAQIAALTNASRSRLITPEAAWRLVQKLDFDIAHNVALFAAEGAVANASAQGAVLSDAQIEQAEVEALVSAVSANNVSQEAADRVIAELKAAIAQSVESGPGDKDDVQAVGGVAPQAFTVEGKSVLPPSIPQ